MANQGILAQSKPSANTNTVLYSAPIDSSASAVLLLQMTELVPHIRSDLKTMIKNWY